MATGKTTSIDERLGDASAQEVSSMSAGPEDVHRIVPIELTELHPNPEQPRKVFDKGALKELADSIAARGQLQPIIVKERQEGGYFIVAGERRFRAHQLLKKETIEAILTTGDPGEIALIENVQRENLNPFELAEGLQRLMESKQYTQAQIGKVIGKRQNTVSAVLRLNSLPEVIKEEYPTSDTVSQSMLVEIAQAKGESVQLKLWGQAKTGRLTVKAARTAKAGDEVKPALPPQERMLSTGRTFLRSLKKILHQDLVANEDQYHELLELRRQIDEEVDALQAEVGQPAEKT